MKKGAPFKKAEKVFKSNSGMMRTSQAIKLGIHPRTLYAMRDEGMIVELSRGLYRIAKMKNLSSPDLVIVASKVPSGIICLISALSCHGITTQIPHEVHVAIARNAQTPRIDYPPVKTYRFCDASFEAGIEEHTIDGMKIKIFSAAKTIADCFKFRNKIGFDVALEALKLGLERKKATPDQIMKCAKVCRIERVITPYLEALI